MVRRLPDAEQMGGNFVHGLERREERALDDPQRRPCGLAAVAVAFRVPGERGLHRTYVSGIERGVRNPTVTIVEKVAVALKVPASRLLDDVAAPKRAPASKRR